MFKKILVVFGCFTLIFLNVSALLAEQATSDTDQAAAPVSQEQLSGSLENVNVSLANLKTQMDSGIADNKLTGEVYFGWSKGLQNSSVLNGFDVQRVYLTYKQKLDKGAALRVTLDVGRLSTVFDTSKKSQNLYSFLKYAYLELPMNPLAELSLTGRFCLQQTVWIDFVNKIWSHNYIAKAFVDNEGVMSSADFGVGATGKLTISGIPEIEYHSTLLNGSGYKLPEQNGAKDIALRLNSDLASIANVGTVTAGAFVNLANSFTSQQSESQSGVLLALKNSRLRFRLLTGERVGNRNLSLEFYWL